MVENVFVGRYKRCFHGLRRGALLHGGHEKIKSDGVGRTPEELRVLTSDKVLNVLRAIDDQRCETETVNRQDPTRFQLFDSQLSTLRLLGFCFAGKDLPDKPEH